MSTQAPRFGLETEFGPVIVTMSSGPEWASVECGRYVPGTYYDGKAHINGNEPTIVFRGQEYIGHVNLTHETGEWLQRPGYPGDRLSRRPQWDTAPPSYHARILRAIVESLDEYLAAHPATLDASRRYQHQYEIDALRTSIEEAERKVKEERDRLRNLRAALRKIEQGES